jgi:hypothetical protein
MAGSVGKITGNLLAIKRKERCKNDGKQHGRQEAICAVELDMLLVMWSGWVELSITGLISSFLTIIAICDQGQ